MPNYYVPRHYNTREVVPLQTIIPSRQRRSSIYLTNGIIPIRDIMPTSPKRPSTTRPRTSTRHQTTPHRGEILHVNLHITTEPPSHHIPATQRETVVREEHREHHSSSSRHNGPAQTNYHRFLPSTNRIFPPDYAPRSFYQHHDHHYTPIHPSCHRPYSQHDLTRPLAPYPLLLSAAWKSRKGYPADLHYLHPLSPKG